MTDGSDIRPVFRLAIGRWIHISGWPAVLLAPFVIPVILFNIVVGRLFGLTRDANLSAQDVENYLRDFLQGTGGDWDWDDFTSIPIADPKLESIREEAANVALPLDAEGEATLQRLLEAVRAL